MKDNTRERFLYYTHQVAQLLIKLQGVRAIDSRKIATWLNQIEKIEENVKKDLIKVAVTGAVKSGKSTVINSLVGEDLLKRGAGIVTAFITRLRIGESKKRGWLELKSLRDVNDEVSNILRNLAWMEEIPQSLKDGRIDLRDDGQRGDLVRLVESLKDLSSQRRKKFASSLILLDAYLRGFCTLETILKDEERVQQVFEEISMDRHREYVSDETLAVYAKDMELHCPSFAGFYEGLEVADCQGADSPNPLHLTLLQDYLIRCNLVIYVVSSRVGLRKADLYLLDFLKKVGLLSSTIFLLNIDIDDHPDLEDLYALIDRTNKELQWFTEKPLIFAFSALAELLKALDGSIAAVVEEQKIKFWREFRSDMLAFSERSFDLFKKVFSDRLTGYRALHIYEDGLGRLRNIVSYVFDSVKIQERMCRLSLEKIVQMKDEIAGCKEILRVTLANLENVVDGLYNSVAKECEKSVESFFGGPESPVLREIMNIVDRYEWLMPLESDQGLRLWESVYEFYVGFRENLWRFIAETVNVRIVEFAKAQENFLYQQLRHSFRTMMSVFKVAVDNYYNTLSHKLNMSIPYTFRSFDFPQDTPEVDGIPSLSFLSMDHSLGKGVLLVKYGLNRVISALAKLRDALGRRTTATKMLKSPESPILGAVELVKREVWAEIEESFERYGESFKKEYLLPLIDQGFRRLIREFRLSAESYTVDIDYFSGLGEQKEVEEERWIMALQEARGMLVDMENQLKKFAELVSKQ